MPTRLADGFGLKELAYPPIRQGEFTPGLVGPPFPYRIRQAGYAIVLDNYDSTLAASCQILGNLCQAGLIQSPTPSLP